VPSDLLAAAVFALLVAVMLGFALGTARNVRIGNETLRWLEGGLPLLGRRTTLRWLGSSAVELRMADAEPPFRDATIVVVLEPRDVGLIWAFSRARGRRDFLIVRANLRHAPRFSLDAGNPQGWTGRIDAPSDGERRVAWADELDAIATPGADLAVARAAWATLDKASGGIWRLTIQPVVPHLEVHLRLPRSRGAAATELFGKIRELALDLGRSA
jgi:hypothetical protein